MKVGLFGTGAYGMAIASILENNNNKVTMWTKFEEERNILSNTRKNDSLIKDYILPETIDITTDILECINEKDLLIIAIPVAFVADLCNEISKYIKYNQHVCIVSKGIEKTGLFAHEIIEKYLNTDKIAILSGPSFAKDVVQKKPIGLTLATKNIETMNVVNIAFRNTYTKIRNTNDIIGTEICGAIKNVIAVASGILNGLNVTDSTSAMFITEAIHDMEEIINAFGGDDRTVLSYAGFGDLLLTCTSVNSRNYSFGNMIGKGATREEVDNYLKTTTVEGYYTLESIYKLLKDKDVKIPIIDLIYNIVNKGTSPEILLKFLIEKI